jgi:hypothetical protein
MDHAGVVVDRYCYIRGPDGMIIGLVEELR